MRRLPPFGDWFGPTCVADDDRIAWYDPAIVRFGLPGVVVGFLVIEALSFVGQDLRFTGAFLGIAVVVALAGIGPAGPKVVADRNGLTRVRRWHAEARWPAIARLALVGQPRLSIANPIEVEGPSGLLFALPRLVRIGGTKRTLQSDAEAIVGELLEWLDLAGIPRPAVVDQRPAPPPPLGP